MAKKKIRYSQNGEQIKGPIGFLNSYMESPMFKDRFLQNNSPDDYVNQIDYIHNAQRMYRPDVVKYSPQGSFTITGHRTANDAAALKEAHASPNANIVLDPSQVKESNDWAANDEGAGDGYMNLLNDVLPHEYTHSTRALGLLDNAEFARKWRDSYHPESSDYDAQQGRAPIDYLSKYATSGDKHPFEEYYKHHNPFVHDEIPGESYADLNALRWRMYERGIYDTRKRPMTLDDLKKAQADPVLNRDFNFRRMLRYYTPEKVVELNNKVASNTPGIGKAAQHGGNMKQNAGDSDAYDFGSAVLQNYMQHQQESQDSGDNIPQDQQDYTPDNSQDNNSDNNQSNSDDLAIPDAGYFARKAFEYTGDNGVQDQLDDMRDQMEQLRNENMAFQSMYLGNYDTSDDDNDTEGNSDVDYNTSVPDPSSPYETPPTPMGRGTAAVRHNNPGNIKFGSFAKQFGAVQGDAAPDGGSFAHFPSVDAGLTAQKALLTSAGYHNLSVTDAMKKWSSNGPYAERLGKAFGNRKISELSPPELDQLIKMQVRGEDTHMANRLGYQYGGKVPVAEYPAEKYHGLNNESLNELLIKNKGYSQYRGLDSGKPVHLKDELGMSTVLFGPDDLATLYGNVYEHR